MPLPEMIVSVLTPSLNQAPYLDDCLTSVALQRYHPVEHIVADGGSTDGSVELLASCGDRVRWVSEPDGGQSQALNKAFTMSSGEIIGWLNADDAYADRRTLDWVARAFRGDPRVELVYGHAAMINEANEVLQVRAVPPFRAMLLRAVNYVMQPAVFVRRSAIERSGRFVSEDLRFVMDRELWFRLASVRTKRIARVLAVDRHQRERKVLQDAFRGELGRMDQTWGIRPNRTRRVLAEAVRAAIRAEGLPHVLALPHVLDPALRLSFPPVGRRTRLQLAARRRAMPFG